MPEQKKICFITTISLTMKTFVLESALHLQKECGYEITLICSPDADFQASLPPTIRFIPVPMARGIDFSAFCSIWRFYRIFRKEKFDLVQYSTPNASCYASIAARLARVPKRLYCQWGIRYVGLSGLSRWIFKGIEKLVCSLSSHVRGQSRKNIDFAIREKVCSCDKISLVGVGGTIGVCIKECDAVLINSPRIALRNKYKIPCSAFVFGFVGRINADKGVNELIQAFSNISLCYPDCYLVLVGNYDNKNPISLINKEIIEKNKNIVCTGGVCAKEVFAYMAMFDVLTHPTYREGFGKVIQEAMGMCLPVITTNIPGPSEVIEENISGLLVNLKDVEDLEAKMRLLHDSPTLCSRLSSNARMRAEKYFDRPIMLDNVKNDMENIINN